MTNVTEKMTNVTEHCHL